MRPTWNRTLLRALSLVVAIVLSFSSVSRAAGGPAEESARRGVQLRRERRNSEALAAFREAYALAPSPKGRAQIALAEQSLAMWLQAEVDLMASLAASDDPWVTRNRSVLEEAEVRVGAHLGFVRVETNAEDAHLSIEGVEGEIALPLEQPIRVPASELLLTVRADGYKPFERRVRVNPGAELHVMVALEPTVDAARPSAVAEAPVAPPPPAATIIPRPSLPVAIPRQPSVNQRGLLIASYTVLAVGVVGVGVGSYFGALTLSTKAKRDRECVADACSARGLDLDQSARVDANVSTVAIGAGAVGALVGTWLLWKATRADNIRVGAAAAPQGGALQLSGAW